jgi:putative copper export protein
VRRLQRIVAAAIAVLAASSIVLLAARSATMSGQPALQALPAIPLVITATHYGRVWLVRPAMLVVLWISWWLCCRRRDACAPWIAMLIAFAVFGFSRSASGHAADTGDFGVQEFIDWLHLLSMSVWVGGVFAALLAVFPALREYAPGSAVPSARFARRLSQSSAIALGVVVASGIYNAWMRLGTLPALVNTHYGRTLCIKLILVGIVITLGAVNRFVHVRRMVAAADAGDAASGNTASIRQFSRTVLAESAFMIAVLIAVGFLLTGMPPGDMTQMPMAQPAAARHVPAFDHFASDKPAVAKTGTAF